MKKKRLADFMKQTPVIAGYLAAVGLLSYFVMFAFKNASQYCGAGLLESMLVSSLVGVLLCVAAFFFLMMNIGVNDADLVMQQGDKKLRPYFDGVILATAVSLAAYGAVLLVFNYYGWDVFAGPVYYLSYAFFALQEPLDLNTVAADIPLWCRTASFVVYAMCAVPAMAAGYGTGYSRKIASK